MKNSKYYDSKYYSWQKKIGEFGGWANSFKFKEYIHESDSVLDFGCGGGFLLNTIKCKKKIGIETNKACVKTIKKFEIIHFYNIDSALNKIGENSIDKIISNHALEHVENPLIELEKLRRLLKEDGEIIFVVPCESIIYKYRQNDINNHLYSWCPQSLANLFKAAGFNVEFSKAYMHKWPPYYQVISQLGWPIFNLICRIYSRINWRDFQIKIKASKF